MSIWPCLHLLTSSSCFYYMFTRSNIMETYISRHMKSIGECLAWVIGFTPHSVSSAYDALSCCKWYETFHISLYNVVHAVYITFYLTLSLTTDRYNTVSHPARTICGIVRAKNVVSSKLFILVFMWDFHIPLPVINFLSSSCSKDKLNY